MSDDKNKLTASELVNILRPEHDRTSCNDENLSNGICTLGDNNFEWRCARCMLLEIARGNAPKGFDASTQII